MKLLACPVHRASNLTLLLPFPVSGKGATSYPRQGRSGRTPGDEAKLTTGTNPTS